MTSGLEDIRVLDASSGPAGIAAAYCSKLFADAGADVIRIEPPDGDPLRNFTSQGPLAAGTDSALFRYLRQGQRSVTADHDDLAGLVADADLVVTGRRSVLGDPASLAQSHPGLTVVAVTPYGLSGPNADRPASEFTLQADSGALAIRGRPERPPIQAGGQITEWVTGVYAGVGALAAVRRARRTGTGALVDVSWQEVAAVTCTNFSEVFYQLQGQPDLSERPTARSLETPSIEPTLDGYVGFNTNTRQQFDDFLLLIERPDLLDDPEIWKLANRAARWDEWNDIVHEWTTRHTTADIVERAALLRIPVAPVASGRHVLELDHVREREIFQPAPEGDALMPRRPWSVNGEVPAPPRPAPGAGAHQSEVRPRSRSGRRPAADGRGRLPLEGVKVADLTAWWAGPSSTGMLAALGAEVIHVESCRRPDGMRMAGGMFLDQPQWWERSGFFLAANTNKRGLTLDLTNPAGRDLLLKLVSQVDLVVENFTPRVLETFDLGWDVIHAANPQAVFVRMPAFGLTGPWRDRPGFAQTMEQVTGLAWLTGHIDDQPRIQRGPCDPNGGMHAAFAALVGLAERERTGTGCLIEAPMFEAALAVAAEQVLEWTAYGHELQRAGNRSPRAAPQGLYPCRGIERWLAVSVLSDHQWLALRGALGEPEWAKDPTFDTAEGRSAGQDELDGHLTEWAAEHDVEAAVELLASCGVPAAGVCDPRTNVGHPHLVARGFHETMDHPLLGPIAVPGPPFRYGDVTNWIRRPAPTLGEHTIEILAELGCGDGEIDALAAEEIIGTWPLGL